MSSIDWDEEEAATTHEPTIAEAERDEVRKIIYRNDEYKFIETETRNVLLVGRTRSGKSTAMEVLKDPCYVPKSDTIFSETVEPAFKSFSIQNIVKEQTEEVTLNIIDTPGLFEVKDIESGSERTNEAIKKTIAKCLEHEITNIHIIILFVTFEAGINPNDIKAMQIFLDMFGGSNLKICLCITHADGHDNDWQITRKEELMKYKATKEMIEKEGMEVIFMGCVGSLHNITTKGQLERLYKRVYLMRRNLLKHIFQAENRVQLDTLNVISDDVAKAGSLMENIAANFKKLSKKKDFGTGSMQQLIIEQCEDLKELESMKGIVQMPSLAKNYADMLQEMSAFLTNTAIDISVRKQLCLFPLAAQKDLLPK